MYEMLLEAGAQQNRKCPGDFPTPLSKACYYGWCDKVKTLLAYGADTNIADRDGDKAIHLAIYSENTDCVKILLEAGVPPDLVNEDHRTTPLFIATYKNNIKMMRMLLDEGGDPNCANKRFVTPLHEAVRNENTSAVCLLIKHGANPNARDNLGATPLWQAVYMSEPEIVELLIEHNAALETRANIPTDEIMLNLSLTTAMGKTVIIVTVQMILTMIRN